jgi:LPXTG-site transpeptidase (sortase) family protein
VNRTFFREALFLSVTVFSSVAVLYVIFALIEPETNISFPSDTVALAFTSRTETEQTAPDLPAHLIIPRIQVDVSVQLVGLNAGAMGVPTNFSDVGWYQNGTRPGLPGSAVIDGHRSGKWIPHGVFFNLKHLASGDVLMTIDAKGATTTFQVTKIVTYPYNAKTDDIFISTDGKAHLNLITCGGVWDKWIALFIERIVVFSAQIK